MNTFICLIILFLIFFITCILFNNDFINPSFLFVSSFLATTFYLFCWINRLQTDIHFNTILVITGGCLLYVGASWGVKLFYLSVKDVSCNRKNILQNIKYSVVICYIYTFLYIVNAFFYLRQLSIVVGIDLKIHSVSAIISKYNVLSKFSLVDVRLPIYLKILNEFMIASGYICIYILINNLIVEGKKHIHISLALNIFLAIITTVLSGGRGAAIRLILAVIIMFYILWNQNTNWNKKFKLKYIILYCVIMMLLAVSFQTFGKLIGRTEAVERTIGENLLMYAGGPIKNLDIFLNSYRNQQDLWGEVTFMNQYRVIGRIFEVSEYIYEFKLKYNVVNGLNLGNTYTLFYPYIYDFGIWGMILIVTFMGIITQYVYMHIKRRKTSGNNIQMGVIIYSFLAYTIIFSSFCERFVDAVFSVQFWRYIFYFYFTKFMITKVKVKL